MPLAGTSTLAMSSNNGQPPPTCPSSTGGAAEDTAEAEKEEEITLFAPFGAQKPSKSVFQHSSEYEGEFSDGRSDSREIEFQSSETPSVGNAPKVLFRKLKAAVSGSSLSSLSMSTSVQEPSSVTLKPPVNKPPGSSNRAGPNSSKAPSADTRAYRSRNSPTPSLGSSVAISVEQGGISGDPHMRTVEQALSEEPKISLTSYSDAHGHVLRKTGHPSAGGGGGVVRQQSQAVNKSEMLKRFGTIADNKGVQVSGWEGGREEGREGGRRGGRRKECMLLKGPEGEGGEKGREERRGGRREGEGGEKGREERRGGRREGEGGGEGGREEGREGGGEGGGEGGRRGGREGGGEGGRRGGRREGEGERRRGREERRGGREEGREERRGGGEGGGEEGRE